MWTRVLEKWDAKKRLDESLFFDVLGETLNNFFGERWGGRLSSKVFPFLLTTTTKGRRERERERERERRV